jgi:GMP reductase
LDVANGYSIGFVDTVRTYRSEFPNHIIIAGNVCTPEMTIQLIEAGADIIKIGIGPGSVCITRLQTGVGYPQLSCVMECSEVAHSMNAFVMSDGGCSSPGDIAKAFGGGADFVMIGGMLAGHEESGGEVIIEGG